jgi:murein DD-endopeptidase MepM/ murein hydrolase activator NlpD
MRFSRSQGSRRKKIYTILFFSDTDDKPRGLKLSRNLLIGALIGIFILISTVALVAVIHTPIKYIVFPQTFAESAIRARQIQELHRKVEAFSYELERLKLYNNLLRQALGEKVSDSISVNVKNLSALSKKTLDISSFDEDLPVLQLIGKEKVSLPFIFPVSNGFITREFDPGIQHFGIDIAAREGDVVRAVADGYVIFSDWTYKDGYVTMILHGFGFISVYKHARMNLKQKNIFVRQGEAIALVGKTGKTAKEPHLHFELWKNGRPVNPKLYISN